MRHRSRISTRHTVISPRRTSPTRRGKFAQLVTLATLIIGAMLFGVLVGMHHSPKVTSPMLEDDVDDFLSISKPRHAVQTKEIGRNIVNLKSDHLSNVEKKVEDSTKAKVIPQIDSNEDINTNSEEKIESEQTSNAEDTRAQQVEETDDTATEAVDTEEENVKVTQSVQKADNSDVKTDNSNVDEDDDFNDEDWDGGSDDNDEEGEEEIENANNSKEEEHSALDMYKTEKPKINYSTKKTPMKAFPIKPMQNSVIKNPIEKVKADVIEEPEDEEGDDGLSLGSDSTDEDEDEDDEAAIPDHSGLSFLVDIYKRGTRTPQDIMAEINGAVSEFEEPEPKKKQREKMSRVKSEMHDLNCFKEEDLIVNNEIGETDQYRKWCQEQPKGQSLVQYKDPKRRYSVVCNSYKRQVLLRRSIDHFTKCPNIHTYYVVWSETDKEPPEWLYKRSQNPEVKVKIIRHKINSLNNRFYPIPGIETEAIFSIDDDVQFDCQDVEYAFYVWSLGKQRMVGMFPRAISCKGNSFDYHSGGTQNHAREIGYRMVLTKSAFYHRAFHDLYMETLPPSTPNNTFHRC